MSSATAIMEKTSAVAPRKTIQGHTDSVFGVEHLPGRQCIITCSKDGSLRLWDLESGAQIGDEWRDEGDETGVMTMALSPNGKTVASGSIDRIVRLWDVETGKVITKWTGHTGFVESVCWSPDGERVVSGCGDGTARVWDVESGEPVQGLNPIKTGHQHVYAVNYSPSATKFATGGYNENGIKIWDAKTGQLFTTINCWAIRSLAWTSDEKKLISGTWNGSIGIFDTATWQQIAILEGHQQVVHSITLSRNDRLLASTAWDHTTRLWNLDTSLPVGPPLQHQDDVECAAFSADAKLLATACDDSNTYVWDVRAILKAAGLEGLMSIPDAPKVEHIGRLSSIFCSPPNTEKANELDQLPMQTTSSPLSPHVVEVVAMRDTQATRRPETVRRVKNPKPWWVRMVLFLCCVTLGTDNSPGTEETHRST